MDKKPYVDFQAIKDRVRILDVLGRYNVRLRPANKSQFRGACPLPSHASKESRDSFFASPEKNVWCCHSDSCRKASGRDGGSVIDLVAALERVSAREAALRLEEWFPHGGGVAECAAALDAARAADDSAASPLRNKPLAFRLKDVNPEHPRIQKKGITVDTARSYGIGWFPGKGSMRDRIVFELWEDGQMVGYAGRTVLEPGPENEKWKLPKGLVKSFVYGLERCDPKLPLVLGESFWLPPFMREKGAQAAALMGSEMTEDQERRLDPFGTVVLAFDSDEAGKRKATPIAERLRRNHAVKLAFLKE